MAEDMFAAHSQGAAVPPGSELKYSHPATPPKSPYSLESWETVDVSVSMGTYPLPQLAGLVRVPATTFEAGTTPCPTMPS